MVECPIRMNSVNRVSASSGAAASYRHGRSRRCGVRRGRRRNHRRGVDFRRRLLLLGNTDGSHRRPVFKAHPPASSEVLFHESIAEAVPEVAPGRLLPTTCRSAPLR